MELIIKANDQTEGRDRIAKFLQYTTRIVWHQMELRSANKYVIEYIKNLELSFFSFRRILRLGRCFETFYTALNALNINDPVIRITETINRIMNALYMYCDHVVWLSQNRLLKSDPQKWDYNADTFSLIVVITKFIRDFYELYNIRQIHTPTYLRSSELGNVVKFPHSIQCLFMTVICHRNVFIDLFIQFCDFFMLLTSLSIFTISPSAEGMFGAIGSIAGYITLLDPMAKLTP